MRARMRARNAYASSHIFKSYARKDARNAYVKIPCADTSVNIRYFELETVVPLTTCTVYFCKFCSVVLQSRNDDAGLNDGESSCL